MFLKKVFLKNHFLIIQLEMKQSILKKLETNETEVQQYLKSV